MNKIILSLLLTTAIASPATAQNCVNSSRCDELGYVKTADDCNGLDTLICPFDSSKFFCAGSNSEDTENASLKECAVGDILYSDKKCYTGTPSGLVPIAVVFDTSKRYALALEEAEKKWGPEEDINTLTNCTSGAPTGCSMNSGKENTSVILAYGKANVLGFPAAEYCNTYATWGAGVGNWWLPSHQELTNMRTNLSTINASLSSLGKNIKESSHYWTSSEVNRARALDCFMGNGGVYEVTGKIFAQKVRCAMSY